MNSLPTNVFGTLLNKSFHENNRFHYSVVPFHFIRLIPQGGLSQLSNDKTMTYQLNNRRLFRLDQIIGQVIILVILGWVRDCADCSGRQFLRLRSIYPLDNLYIIIPNQYYYE